MRRAGLLVTAALLGGCGPALAPLLAQHHLREAVCAAHDGGADERAEVGRALAADAGMRVHVAMVTPEELARVLPDRDPAPLSAVRFARVRVTTDLLPVDALTADVDLVRADGVVVSRPTVWRTLAAATHEHLPPRVPRETYLTAGNLARGAAAALTLGLSLMVTQFEPGTVLVDAPREDYVARAPRATALHDVMQARAGCVAVPSPTSHNVGARCDWFVMIDADTPAAVELRVTLRATAERIPRGTSDDACVATSTTRVALGPARDLDAITVRAFGDELRPISAHSPPR